MLFLAKNMTKTITADIISDFFIQKSIEVDNPAGGNISHIKLQKLITYSYVWYLGLRGKKLFKEGLKICNHGYFVESQRERFKPFGFMPIILPDFECNIACKLNYNIRNFLDNLWDAYGRFEGFYLSELQCMEPPYEESSGLLVASFCVDVDDKLIKKFYSYKNKELGWYVPQCVCLFIDEESYKYCIGSKPAI